MSSVAPRMLGPYRILETLGRGGMGVVYRARDESSGTEVAIKTVLLANAGALSGIRREIRALASIHHPGIVRIVSEGTDDGLPWYAMELVAGESLRVFQGTVAGRAETYRGDAPTTAHAPAAGSAWWTEVLAPRPITDELSRRGPGSGKLDRSKLLLSPEALPEAAWGALADVLTVVRRLCAPLGYLHGEGIVHRDLKPENVLVRPDGFPVLVDFGLMSRSGAGESRELLDVAGGVSGTVAYMSPEQARGEIVDARRSLLARLHPLRARDGAAAFRRGRTAPGHPHARGGRADPGLPPVPRRPRSARGAPREAFASPRDRIGHADAVAACLEDLGASPALALGTPARPCLYRPRFAGREEPMRPIEDRCARLAARDPAAPGVVLVSGEAGAGKTRFLTELSLRAAPRCRRPRRRVRPRAALGPDARRSRRSPTVAAQEERARRPASSDGARALAAYEPLLSISPAAELPATGELLAARRASGSSPTSATSGRRSPSTARRS
ncbi:MAG: serine/threonine-protein kinase [Acidobacteriota bacterium]